MRRRRRRRRRRDALLRHLAVKQSRVVIGRRQVRRQDVYDGRRAALLLGGRHVVEQLAAVGADAVPLHRRLVHLLAIVRPPQGRVCLQVVPRPQPAPRPCDQPRRPRVVQQVLHRHVAVERQPRLQVVRRRGGQAVGVAGEAGLLRLVLEAMALRQLDEVRVDLQTLLRLQHDQLTLLTETQHTHTASC